jgi:hypothetical protein
MSPNLEPEQKPEPPEAESADLNGAAIPEANATDATRQKQLWEEYRLQQRRRTCSGCGDDGAIF